MNWRQFAALVVLGIGGVALFTNAYRSYTPRTEAIIVVPPDLRPSEQAGAGYFAQHCQACHGENGHGPRTGPPLVHKIYEPSHHSDGTFVRAVRQGVIAHHWRYGNMPSLPDVTDQEAAAIIRYVRALQRANGIR